MEQIAVLFAASHETVAKGVTWTLFLLAQHPTVMAELDDELRSVLGDSPPSLSDLARLPLLDAVTKEAMRLFPPVPWASRKIRTETELAGIPVRHYDYVVLNHFMTHRSPEVFPQPLRFRPERWFETKPDNYAYVPFSAGPRSCIGKALGTATIHLMVAMILQRFRLTVAPNSRISRSVQVTEQFGDGVSTLFDRGLGREQTDPNERIRKSLSAADRTAYDRALGGENPGVTFAEAVDSGDFSELGGCTKGASEAEFGGAPW